MLWTLLTAISSMDFLAGAVAAAEHAKAGFGGYLLATSAGLVLAVCNAWTVYKVAEIVFGRLEHYSASRQEWCARTVYFSAFLWGFAALVIGEYVGSVLVRLVA